MSAKPQLNLSRWDQLSHNIETKKKASLKCCMFSTIFSVFSVRREMRCTFYGQMQKHSCPLTFGLWLFIMVHVKLIRFKKNKNMISQHAITF